MQRLGISTDLKWDIYIIPLPLKAQESMHKREWKGCKSNELRNWYFLDTRVDNHEFTMIVTAKLKSV